MNIKITTDSTCDLSPELLAQYNISVLPLTVVKNGEGYKDRVTITPADIFNHVANGGDLCTTTALNIGEYTEFFEKFSTEYDGIIHINLGSGFSSCYQNACLAAEDFPKVRTVDSKNLSTGQGLVVLKACELSKTCEDMDALKAQLDVYTEKVEASFVLNQLQYMVKGGRCSMVAALGANLLNLKPCIEVKDGKMSVVKKYRGSYAKCLATYVKDRLSGRDDIDRTTLFVTSTQVTDDCNTAVMDAIGQCDPFENVYRTEAGCTISCHCGPDTLGVLFVRK